MWFATVLVMCSLHNVKGDVNVRVRGRISSVPQGTQATLVCKTEGLVTHWSKNSTKLVVTGTNATTNTNARFRFDRKGRTLVIMRVDKSDEGRYYCHAETKPGVVESGYTDLRVEVPPTVQVGSLFFTTSELRLLPGQLLALYCRSYHYSTLSWYFNGLPVRHDATNGNISVAGATLIVAAVTSAYMGTYKCTVHNEHFNASASVNVAFYNPLNVSAIPQHQEVPEGSEISFQCIFQGGEKPEAFWIHENPMSFSNDFFTVTASANSLILSIDNVTVSDSGYYQCMVGDAFDSASARVRLNVHGPVSTSPTKTVTDLTKQAQSSTTTLRPTVTNITDEATTSIGLVQYLYLSFAGIAMTMLVVALLLGFLWKRKRNFGSKSDKTPTIVDSDDCSHVTLEGTLIFGNKEATPNKSVGDRQQLECSDGHSTFEKASDPLREGNRVQAETREVSVVLSQEGTSRPHSATKVARSTAKVEELHDYAQSSVGKQSQSETTETACACVKQQPREDIVESLTYLQSSDAQSRGITNETTAVLESKANTVSEETSLGHPTSKSGFVPAPKENFGSKMSPDMHLIGILRLLIGPKGGSGHSGDLSLFAPERALSSEISITLRNYICNLTLPGAEELFIFSPVLSLEPHGQTFDQPLQLKFPFSAVPGSWLLKLMRANCGNSETPSEWETLLEYNTDTGEIVHSATDCSYDVERRVLILTHFCRYCWVGKNLYNKLTGRKKIFCSVFGYQPYANRNSWILIVYMHDRCLDVFEDVKKYELQKTPARSLFDGPWALDIDQRGSIQVEVGGSSWVLHDTAQSVQSLDLWRNWLEDQCRFQFRASLRGGCDHSEVSSLKITLTACEGEAETVLIAYPPLINQAGSVMSTGIRSSHVASSSSAESGLDTVSPRSSLLTPMYVPESPSNGTSTSRHVHEQGSEGRSEVHHHHGDIFHIARAEYVAAGPGARCSNISSAGQLEEPSRTVDALSPIGVSAPVNEQPVEHVDEDDDDDNDHCTETQEAAAAAMETEL